MVDRDKAERLLMVLLDAVFDLNRYRASVTLEQLESHRDTQHMVLHALYIAVRSLVDMAMHVAADAGLPQPVSYRDSFQRLVEAGLIEHDLGEKLEGWAGLSQRAGTPLFCHRLQQSVRGTPRVDGPRALCGASARVAVALNGATACVAPLW